MANTVRSRVGLLIGINYLATPEARLNGCINDVLDVSAYLKTHGFTDVEVLTDQNGPATTSRSSIVNKLMALSSRTWKEDIQVVWIHYSGHGASVRDTNRDELDGKDECVVPADYMTDGLLSDDAIRNILTGFNPRTLVVCVMDACHSATIGDMRFLWNILPPFPPRATTQNVLPCAANVIMLSGCRDNQTSADAYNAAVRKYQGAMTAALLDLLKARPALRSDVFALVPELQSLLRRRGFSQVPQLASSRDLSVNPTERALIPAASSSTPVSNRALLPNPASRASFMPAWKRAILAASLSARAQMPLTALNMV